MRGNRSVSLFAVKQFLPLELTSPFANRLQTPNEILISWLDGDIRQTIPANQADGVSFIVSWLEKKKEEAEKENGVDLKKR